MPPSCSVPLDGAVRMITFPRPLALLSVPSLKPKSPATKPREVSSSVTSVLLSAPVGGSLTGVTLTVIVWAAGSRSLPPKSVPPSSCTWKVKLA